MFRFFQMFVDVCEPLCAASSAFALREGVRDESQRQKRSL
jgi:hypothetical protein